MIDFSGIPVIVSSNFPYDWTDKETGEEYTVHGAMIMGTLYVSAATLEKLKELKPGSPLPALRTKQVAPVTRHSFWLYLWHSFAGHDWMYTAGHFFCHCGAVRRN